MTYTTSLSENFSTVEGSHCILCFHINATNRIQSIRVKTIANTLFERVVFPRERLIFEATPEAYLEIYSSNEDYIIVPCQQLTITESFLENLT